MEETTKLAIENKELEYQQNKRIDVDYGAETSRFYNKYVRFYNGYGKPKVVIIGELNNILNGLRSRKNSKRKNIDTQIGYIENNIVMSRVNDLSKGNDISRERALQVVMEKQKDDKYVNFYNLIYSTFDDSYSLRNKSEDLENIYNLAKTISDDAGSIMQNIYRAYESLITIQRIVPNMVSINIITDKIINQGYPKGLKAWEDLSDQENAEYLRELDKNTNGHKHRKPQIIDKYFSFKADNPDESDLTIRFMVVDWYFNLTGKEIGEGTIRSYLGEK